MSTDVLTLMQWLSPGFPVGAFAYSHGLEQVIDAGSVGSADTLRPWLEDVLCHGTGQADLVLLVRAYRGEARDALDAEARAFASSAGRLIETLDQGAAFARTVDAIWHTRIGPRAYPVAVGVAAGQHGLPLTLTAQAYAQAFIANLVSAAVRLIPLGQTEGQRLLADLSPLIERIAAAAMAEDAPLFSNCIAADIAAMRHETQYSKVFRT
jgi:urease accessory protein